MRLIRPHDAGSAHPAGTLAATSPADAASPAATRQGTDRTSQLQPLGLVEFVLLGRSNGAVDLATGVPTLPESPAELLEAACAAIMAGNNQYDNPAGNAELRAAAAALHGADPDTEITVTSGSTEGLNIALQTLAQPGDEVIVIEPFFEAYLSAVRLSGAVPRLVRLAEPGWTWRPDDLEAAFGPRTRAVIVNSPHNPTGRVFTRAELTAVLELCARWNAYLISDEVYVELVDEPSTLVLPSALADADGRVVSLRSLSKSHAISGWRIGWIHASPDLTRTFRIVHETFTAGVAAPLQAAAAAVVRHSPGWTDAQRAALRTNRGRIVSALENLGLHCHPPEGSAFLLARLPDGAEDSPAFSRRMIAEVGVSGAPGVLFFEPPETGLRHVRFAFNKADSVIDAAVDRLACLSMPG